MFLPESDQTMMTSQTSGPLTSPARRPAGPSRKTMPGWIAMRRPSLKNCSASSVLATRRLAASRSSALFVSESTRRDRCSRVTTAHNVPRRVSGSCGASLLTQAADRLEPRSSGAGFGLAKVQRAGVHAVALAGRCGSVIEYVTQVRSALLAADFGAHHEEAAVFVELDVLPVGGLPETGPSGSGVELGVRAEQLGAAGRAVVGPVIVRVPVLACERALSALLAHDVVLLTAQLLPPLSLGLLNPRTHVPTLLPRSRAACSRKPAIRRPAMLKVAGRSFGSGIRSTWNQRAAVISDSCTAISPPR